ncbi:LysR family transcriptional regulator [Mesorhizobium sp.]|uniref:helix-turn-helix domain-containing protein n=1 Tax=Mesorhizobium sp. TaxID=1871066 RepID=UPI003457EF26
MVEEGSFVRAAARLRISPPALSQTYADWKNVSVSGCSTARPAACRRPQQAKRCLPASLRHSANSKELSPTRMHRAIDRQARCASMFRVSPPCVSSCPSSAISAAPIPILLSPSSSTTC